MLIHCNGVCDEMGCRGHDVLHFEKQPEMVLDASELLAALFTEVKLHRECDEWFFNNPNEHVDIVELQRLRAASSAPWRVGSGGPESQHHGPRSILSDDDRGPCVRAEFNSGFHVESIADAAYVVALTKAAPALLIELADLRRKLSPTDR